MKNPTYATQRVPRTTIKMTVPRAASVSLVEEIKSQLAFSEYDLTVEDIDDEAAVKMSGQSGPFNSGKVE